MTTSSASAAAPVASSARPNRRLQILLPLVMLPTVAVSLSLVMTWATVGFGPEFLGRWLRGCVTTLVVLPFVLLFLGVLESLVDKALGSAAALVRKLVVAGLTAVFIETVIAFAVTLAGHPFDATFASNWWLAFSRALPVGLVISLFMCFYMKPKLDRLRQPA